jgi:L-iditol 2-dehydrogenase/L-idonate 5-dehydrogenase
VTLPSESLVVTHAADDLRVEPVTLREPAADDEAVVEVAFGGIYGPDLHYWIHGAAGESILRAPMVLGHEVVGTVAKRQVRAAAQRRAPCGGSPSHRTAHETHRTSMKLVR